MLNCLLITYDKKKNALHLKQIYSPHAIKVKEIFFICSTLGLSICNILNKAVQICIIFPVDCHGGTALKW